MFTVQGQPLCSGLANLYNIVFAQELTNEDVVFTNNSRDNELATSTTKCIDDTLLIIILIFSMLPNKGPHLQSTNFTLSLFVKGC